MCRHKKEQDSQNICMFSAYVFDMLSHERYQLTKKTRNSYSTSNVQTSRVRRTWNVHLSSGEDFRYRIQQTLRSGVASVSRIDEIIGRFCKRAL